MNLKRLVKNIFISVAKFLNDGVQFYLDYCKSHMKLAFTITGIYSK